MVDKDYEEHIKNKAVLSYDSRKTAEQLAEYIAGEIIVKRNLRRLKSDLEKVLDKLNEEEKRLVEIRYFGKRKQLREFFKSKDGSDSWSEGKYFRRQKRLGEKVAAMMCSVGITKERYQSEFANVEIFQKLARFVEKGRDEKISVEERRLVGECGSI